MANGGITLFELHSHGQTQIGPRSIPGFGSEPTDEAAADLPVSDPEDDGGRSLVPLLVVAGLLVVASVVAKWKLGGDEDAEDPVPLAESDDLSPTAD